MDKGDPRINKLPPSRDIPDAEIPDDVAFGTPRMEPAGVGGAGR